MGAEHVFFNASADGCFEWDIIDETLNAFRDADGMVRMVSGNGNVGPASFYGPSLLNLTRDCATGPVILSRQNYTGPEDYPHQLWLPATWTADGATVHGLLHDEFHAGRGADYPVPASLCMGGDLNKCWYSSLLSCRSLDGGRSFRLSTSARRPDAVAIAAPIRYAADAGVQGAPAHRHLLRSPNDGLWYTMPNCEYLAQLNRTAGKCVWRTHNLSDSEAWRGWAGDKSGWSARGVNPYRLPPGTDIAPYTAAAVNTRLNGGLTWVVCLQRFVLLGSVLNHTTGRQEIHFQTSEDLLAWTDAELLVELPSWPGQKIGMYPTMLDPMDTSRNFERFGSGSGSSHSCEGHLYFQRFDCPASHTGACLERNWVRYPLKITSA